MPSLTVPGQLTSLDEIADFVLDQCRLAELDKHATYQLRLAVDELATNIIVHGYQENGLTGNIDIAADVSGQSLTVVLEDCAPPYNPLKRDLEPVEEEFDKPLEERPIGGLGIFFVRQAVHDFRYEYRDARNRNILVVHRAGHEPAAATTGANTSIAPASAP
jgi:anti-sigma regulatory factor (Ser/Thr protein kinase)